MLARSRVKRLNKANKRTVWEQIKALQNHPKMPLYRKLVAGVKLAVDENGNLTETEAPAQPQMVDVDINSVFTPQVPDAVTGTSKTPHGNPQIEGAKNWTTRAQFVADSKVWVPWEGYHTTYKQVGGKGGNQNNYLEKARQFIHAMGLPGTITVSDAGDFARLS
jgi:hypothetical protein